MDWFIQSDLCRPVCGIMLGVLIYAWGRLNRWEEER